jgi:Glycosyltransferase family 92
MNDPTQADKWTQFLAHAGYLLEHPSFDAMERAPRLAGAGKLRAVLEAARAGEEWLPILSAAISADGRDLPTTPQFNQLAAWASDAGGSATGAVAAFLEDRSATERFAGFASATETAGADADPSRPGALLAFGSAFNFALAPQDLPIVRPPQFSKLQEILGYGTCDAGASLTEQYEHHLSFTRELHERMLQEGLPVRDGLDVHALIVVSAQDSREWDVAPGAGGPRESRGPYLSVCAVLGYEAPYLLEWIEFHRAIGAERFFLYNNRDREAQRDVLRRYVDDGIVVLHDWPVFPPQLRAYNDCIERHRDDSRWIAFIDVDEFLFSPEQPLPDVLAGYESWPGVVVNRAAFGPSGHELKPPELVIESYLMRKPQGDRHVKSIVDPREVVRCTTPHHFVYASRLPVNEDRYPVRGPLNPPASLVRLRINHYETKSLEEWRAKIKRIQANIVGSPDPRNPTSRRKVGVNRPFEFDLNAAEYSLRDETILKWAPAVREALDEAIERH